MGVDGALQLCAQLQEVRANVSKSALARGPKADAAGGAAAGAAAGSVIEVKGMEQWYDLQMQTKGLLVVNFGTGWYGACKQLKPYWEELAAREDFRSITFAHVTATLATAQEAHRLYHHTLCTASAALITPLLGGLLRDCSPLLDSRCW